MRDIGQVTIQFIYHGNPGCVERRKKEARLGEGTEEAKDETMKE